MYQNNKKESVQYLKKKNTATKVKEENREGLVGVW